MVAVIAGIGLSGAGDDAGGGGEGLCIVIWFNLVGAGLEHVLFRHPGYLPVLLDFQSDSQCPKLILVPRFYWAARRVFSGEMKINTSAFIDFIKARWCMIVALIAACFIVILILLYVAGLLLLPSEITQSSGVVIFWDQ